MRAVPGTQFERRMREVLKPLSPKELARVVGANLPVGAALEVAARRQPRTTAPPHVREIRSLCARHYMAVNMNLGDDQPAYGAACQQMDEMDYWRLYPQDR
jgi:hypothetical protein